MDVEDIEDLYSKPNSDHERLQFDHVIARVKRKNFFSDDQKQNDSTNCSEKESENNFKTLENDLSEEKNADFLNFDLDFNEYEEKKKVPKELSEENDNKKFVNKKTYKQNLIKPVKEKIESKKSDNQIKKVLNTDVPGQATIYLKTWGCAHNNSDSEYMAGQLASYGYNITDNSEEADLWLLNSCTVKSPAEQHFKNYILKGLEDGKRVVVAGCVSQSTPNTSYLNNISIVGVQQIDRVIEVVEETLKGNTVKLTGIKKKENGQTKKKLTQLNMPKIRKNKFIEIISINVGCLNECTYCKTKHARGELASYTMEEITERVKTSIKEGVKEIWLTSEDTGAYGKDLEKKYIEQNSSKDKIPNLPNLLRHVLNVIPKDCRLRLGMTNPPYILEHISEIGDIMSIDDRMYKFLHIPVQSGSNLVLEDMKREYTVEDFQLIVDKMRKKVPGITIATDLILGFPTEAEEDFTNTVDLIEKNKFPVLFINQFYPRPGTPAAKMQLIPANDVKKRTKKMTEIFHSYFPYKNNIGRIYNVLITELSTDKEYYVGHNEFYEQILVPKNDEFLGKILKVKIVSTGKFYMIGKPLNVSFSEKIKLKAFKLNENKLLIGSVILIGLLSSVYLKLKK